MTHYVMNWWYNNSVPYQYLDHYSPKFRFSEAAWSARGRNLNENLLVSMWVYLDDQDTSRNIIYVSWAAELSPAADPTQHPPPCAGGPAQPGPGPLHVPGSRELLWLHHRLQDLHVRRGQGGGQGARVPRLRHGRLHHGGCGEGLRVREIHCNGKERMNQ